MKTSLIGAALLSLSGCGLAMTAAQPDRIDLTQFRPGSARASIAQSLDAHHQTAVVATSGSCETRTLYTQTPDDTSRSTQAQTYGVIDGLTLGTAEVILTPMAIHQRSQEHPQSVRFCYLGDKLASNPVVLP